jgi:probable F420-dependent oxidoreductase
MNQRLIRFGLVAGWGSATTAQVGRWAELARQVEALGFSTLQVIDHFPRRFGGLLSPLPAAMAAAQATTTLRVGTWVLNQNFRKPAVLALEAATIDFLSGGRLELGIGAGSRNEPEPMGGLAEPPARRLQRFREYLTVVKGLLTSDTFAFEGEFHRVADLAVRPPRPVQQPRPPLLVGATHRQALALAAQEAEIVSIAFPELFGRYEVLEQAVGWVREAAGTRYGSLELNMKLAGPLPVGLERSQAAALIVEQGVRTDERRGPFVDAAHALNTPENLLGTVEQAIAHVLELRERWDISYFSYMPPPDRLEDCLAGIAPVVARLSGT